MDGQQNGQPVCGQQVLELLNCTIESPYDKEKCLRLLDSLRQCVINKGKGLMGVSLVVKMHPNNWSMVELEGQSKDDFLLPDGDVSMSPYIPKSRTELEKDQTEPNL